MANMFLQKSPSNEPLSTNTALVRPLMRVRSYMHRKRGLLREALTAQRALKRPLLRMRALMIDQILFVCERFTAHIARKRFLTRVLTQMHNQIAFGREIQTANLAHRTTLPVLHAYVLLQMLHALVAHGAFVQHRNVRRIVRLPVFVQVRFLRVGLLAYGALVDCGAGMRLIEMAIVRTGCTVTDAALRAPNFGVYGFIRRVRAHVSGEMTF